VELREFCEGKPFEAAANRHYDIYKYSVWLLSIYCRFLAKHPNELSITLRLERSP
jgi:hypothetical protein